MIFSAYCLSYGNWTVIPEHWKASFEDMRENGFDAVDLTFSESEERYSMRTFEQQIRIAHGCGLKVFVIPSRIGGRFAGAPLMPGLWLAKHPQCAVPGEPMTACLESAEYRKWSDEFVSKLVSSFDIDGIVWDEPKETTRISTHPATLAKYGASPTRGNMEESFLEYLAELTALARSIRPGLTVTVFNMPGTPPSFTARCPRIPGIDFCGFDGTCSRQSYFHEPPFVTKPTLRETWSRTLAETAGTSCGTFALLENILMPRSVHGEFEIELEKTMLELRPGHFSCYYYGHNNESPEEAQRLTMRVIGKYLPLWKKGN